MVRFVPSRQPVERSCCMSQASLVDTSSTVAAMSPMVGSLSPTAAIRMTVTTNADEIGFESTMPTEIPFTSANTKTRSEEHTSELQSHSDLVCRLLLEKKKNRNTYAR